MPNGTLDSQLLTQTFKAQAIHNFIAKSGTIGNSLATPLTPSVPNHLLEAIIKTFQN